jgi:hypothetical protein
MAPWPTAHSIARWQISMDIHWRCYYAAYSPQGGHLNHLRRCEGSYTPKSVLEFLGYKVEF